ncbi:hypothetical protein BJX62DRAFT_242048 [Aspergillus germanicus]
MRQSSPRRRAADGDDLTPLVQATGSDYPLHLDTRSGSGHRGEHRELPPWSFQHAIFGVMGGFATETQYIGESGQKRILRRNLTPQAISILAKAGHFPLIESQEIEERSKADVYAKAAVVGQCLWFAFQVIGRLFQGLSVTPLETHTAIHVGCAIIIYVVWMRKPYNLSHCVVVKGTNIDYIEALFYLHDISHRVYLEEVQRYEKDRIAYWKKRIIDFTRGTATFRPPPARPILKSITALLDGYHMPVGYISHDKSKTLHSIAADASTGLQLLERNGCYDFKKK